MKLYWIACYESHRLSVCWNAFTRFSWLPNPVIHSNPTGIESMRFDFLPLTFYWDNMNLQRKWWRLDSICIFAFLARIYTFFFSCRHQRCMARGVRGVRVRPWRRTRNGVGLTDFSPFLEIHLQFFSKHHLWLNDEFGAFRPFSFSFATIFSHNRLIEKNRVTDGRRTDGLTVL